MLRIKSDAICGNATVYKLTGPQPVELLLCDYPCRAAYPPPPRAKGKVFQQVRHSGCNNVDSNSCDEGLSRCCVPLRAVGRLAGRTRRARGVRRPEHLLLIVVWYIERMREGEDTIPLEKTCCRCCWRRRVLCVQGKVSVGLRLTLIIWSNYHNSRGRSGGHLWMTFCIGSNYHIPFGQFAVGRYCNARI